MDADEQVLAALLQRRTVMVRGTLDHDQASRAAATLMTLDASGDDRIELHLTGAAGDLEAGLMLIDVIDVLGVPVDTVGLGIVSGGAVGVLAAGRSRRLARHARLHLRQPDQSIAGTAFEVERIVADHACRRESFMCQMVRFTSRPLDEILAQWDAGAFLDPADAVSLGYADSVDF